MQLRMNTRKREGVLLMDCEGRIVFGQESAALRDTVKKALSANANVLLNLKDVSYIDSGGLGTLVSLYATARNAGGALKLEHVTQWVHDLLKVTKLASIFEVFDDEQSAVRSFQSAA